ncbi:hypothetical protein RBH94_14705 [Aestuariibaculum sp. YM273]|uniref:hypothetical protein n=1 Tax=Aestuariibaculum sp. YM273 TaxID=3070659 RepID=UPI0027DCD647|nr:hypothetical protein [Aestuariibaculum sp. YM273]WMI65301.1 hypothetical protein RBH94_14705 [Aestuariibaculum sp. YM273]
MKKLFHYISIIVAIISLINIIQILSLGVSRLSDFGYGALVGKNILLVLSVFIAFKTKSSKKESY